MSEYKYYLPEGYDIRDLPDENNIADLLDEEGLKCIGQEVFDAYDADEKSRMEWINRYEKSLKLALQIKEQKTWPWPNAANVKFPLMTIGALTFHARAYPTLVPSRSLVNVKHLGHDPHGARRRRAERIKTHMNYQFLDEMEDWDEDMDRLLFTISLTGTEFKKVYYSEDQERTVSRHVFAKDLVVDYYATKLEGTRKTHILSMMPNEIKEYMNLGLYCQYDFPSTSQPREDKTTQVADLNQGTNKPSITSGPQPRMVLEQHTYLDLDCDGYYEPYIITIDKDTRKVLRIVARFKKENLIQDKGIVIKIIPDEYFIKYSFIPSPDGGFYDIGFGHLLGPLNEATNSILNQLIDSGSLNNMQAGFMTKTFRQKGGSTTFELGEWKIVNATSNDIRNGILPIPTKEPSGVLLELLQFLISFAQRISSTTDIMVGENPGQNQKATTTLQVVENGMRIFTAIYKRLRRSLSKELMQVYNLNKDHFDSKQYLLVTGADGVRDSFDTVIDDYNDEDIMIIPTADPNALSPIQKMMKADLLLKMIPVGAPPAAVLKRVYDAYEIEDPEEVMPPMQPQPSPEQMKALHDMQLEGAEFQHKANIDNREQDRKEAETLHKIQHDQANTARQAVESHSKTAVAAMQAANQSIAGRGNRNANRGKTTKK